MFCFIWFFINLAESFLVVWRKPPTYEETVEGHLGALAILEPGVIWTGDSSKNLAPFYNLTDYLPCLFIS